MIAFANACFRNPCHYESRKNIVKPVKLLYGRDGMELLVPATAAILAGQQVGPIAGGDPQRMRAAVRDALAKPIGSPPLAELLNRGRPKTLAITVSDVTRPVPNVEFLPALLDVVNEAGVADSQIVIIIGTGMHRPSTPQERRIILGDRIPQRVEVIDHRADDPATLVKVCDDPPVSLCRRFAQADFRIVTGYIEPHFMAGFSGGRKGVCPAMVDLKTIQRFHGYETLAHPNADNGILDGNPCHQIALTVARAVGVDFLFNVAVTSVVHGQPDGQRHVAGIYCGHLEQAHLAGCEQVARWTSVQVDRPFDIQKMGMELETEKFFAPGINQVNWSPVPELEEIFHNESADAAGSAGSAEYRYGFRFHKKLQRIHGFTFI